MWSARANIDQFTIYNEAALGKFSASVEMPYNQVMDADGSKSGFGDVRIGTKALPLDCELLQIAFQFKTYIPSGNFNSAGHRPRLPGAGAAVRPETEYRFLPPGPGGLLGSDRRR